MQYSFASGRLSPNFTWSSDHGSGIGPMRCSYMGRDLLDLFTISRARLILIDLL
jgi:hypothetical protein